MKSWLCSVIAVSLLCAVCSVFVADAKMKKVCSLVFGLVLLLSLLAPLGDFDLEEYNISVEKVRREAAELTENGRREVIERELTAYIWDKAENYGLSLYDVSVRCEPDGTPQRVRIVSDDDCTELLTLIEAELGIRAEMQRREEA